MSTLLEQASLVMIPSGYAEDIVYSVIPQSGAGDLSFTRASIGTRINSAGLVEVCPWNLLQDSNTFSSGNWATYFGTTADNQAISPDGTQNAAKVTLSSGGFATLRQSISGPTNGQPYTFSLYIKQGSGVTGFLDIGDTTGTVNITPTSEWVRYTYTANWNTSLNFVDIELRGASGSAFCYIWGAQLNIGSTAKPYFPTTDRLNVPRLTYQNGGGGCPSLLLEKQSTNETWYSEDFSQSYWTKQGLTVTANSIVSPDGTQNADLLTLNTSLAEHNVYAPASGLPITSNAPYTFSCYVKKGTGRYFCVATYFTGVGFGPYATFDLNTATLVASGASFGTYSSSKIENMGNDWYRCSVSGFGPYTSLIFAPDVRSASSLIPGVPFTGASETMYIWGAQFEASSYPTSYIPTLTTSSATRVADACYKTGISSLIGQTEGVMFADFDMTTNANSGAYQTILNLATDANNSIDILKNNTTAELYIFAINGGVIQVNSVGIAGTNILGRHKIALAYKLNDYVCYLDGVQIYADTSATVPACSNFYVGAYLGASNQLGGSIGEAILFPTRLTNSEIAQLTGNQNYTINQAYASYGVASESPNCVQP